MTPREKLKKGLPEAVLRPRTKVEGEPKPKPQELHEVRLGERLLAVGHSESEAVDRALFLWAPR